MRLNIKISKLAVLLANEHQSDQINVTNDFRINFSMYSFTQKRLSCLLPEGTGKSEIASTLASTGFTQPCPTI